LNSVWVPFWSVWLPFVSRFGSFGSVWVPVSSV